MKTRVGVLRGGPSSEYEISLQSGATILKHLPEHYHPVDIFIDRNGAWHTQGVRHEAHRIFPKLDVIINGLHGEYGENGEVQHLLESHGIPFSGSGRFACALAMNKSLAKNIVGRMGIKTPAHRLIRREEMESLTPVVEELFRSFPQPSVVKPRGGGSSLGITIVGTPEELAHALDQAFLMCDAVLIEEYIGGKEATCSILEDFRGEHWYAFLPSEVRIPPESLFFDYFAKYSGKSEILCPGNFTNEEKRELQDSARRVHEALGLRHYSQSDFKVHPKRGIYFIEVDALPHLAEVHSPYLKALHAVGASTPEFLDHVARLALARG